MRILTRTQYDAICEIVTEQKKRIEELEDKLDNMRSQRDRLQQLIEAQRRFISAHVSAHDIDFPNSYKGYEDKFI